MVLCQSVNFAHTRSVNFFLAFQAKCVHACLTRGFVVIRFFSHTHAVMRSLLRTHAIIRSLSRTHAVLYHFMPFRPEVNFTHAYCMRSLPLAHTRRHAISLTHAIIRSLSRTHAVLYHFMPFRPKVNFTHAYCMRALDTHTRTKLLL